MTSSSRKKLQITRPSILRSTSLKRFCRSAGLSLVFGLAAATGSAADPVSPPAPSPPAVDYFQLPVPRSGNASPAKPGAAPSAARVAAKPGSERPGEDWEEPLKTGNPSADEAEMSRMFQELDRSAQSDVQPYAEPERNPERLKRLNQIRPSFVPPEPGQLPEEISLGHRAYRARMFAPALKPWVASDVWYNPLYFEDVQLERYGHAYPPLIQPVVSMGRMGVQLLALPYAMTLEPISSRVYPLGYYRPGDFAPYFIYQIPLNAEAAINEAAVVTGLFFLIP